MSFIRLSVVSKLNIPIFPNDQLALLADDQTKMASLGEINVQLQRGNIQCKFRALVMKNLQADAFGGTTFHEDNDIQARIKTRQIKIHNKYVVLQTNDSLPLPSATNHAFVKIAAATTIFPDATLAIPATSPLPTSENIVLFPDPPLPDITPTICSTPNPGQPIIFHNLTNNPISIPAKTTFKCLAMGPYPTKDQQPTTLPHSPQLPLQPLRSDDLNINTSILTPSQVDSIVSSCNANRTAFDENLTGGYNHNSGRHYASLRFKSDSRPEAKSLGMPNYSRKCAALQQALMDKLEQQGVLAHPHDHDIQVKLISPSWVLQKGSAKHLKLQDCTLDQLRYVVAFNALNDHLLPQPAKPSSSIKALKFLARWKYHIFADLKNSYFQIHVSKRDWCWLGVMTPFKGVRVLTRAGQGLLNSEAELDELLERVLGHHIASGICEIARDDIQVGGDTIDQAISNWNLVLTALANSNLKLTAHKVRFFPQQTEIYGWKYSLDGSIQPSDHILTDLGLTDLSSLKTVKSVNSWRGLYKTLLPALPNLATLMDPFDRATAQHQTKGLKEFEWTPQLVAAFNLAQDHLKKATTRTLPKPHEQLLLQPDGAQTPPCIGWCLFVLRQIAGTTVPIPVQFASAKLNAYMSLWKPCEIEAIAAATAIEQCAHWIMEADKPTIVCPDSKAVVQATERMRRGQMSKNPRLQTILSCVNRRPVIFYHSSAKLGQHILGDTCSRTDKSCNAADCAVERFLEDIPSNIQLMASTLPPQDISDFLFRDSPPCVTAATAQSTADWLAGPGILPIGPKETWRSMQRQDPDTNHVIHMITTGDSPRKSTSGTAVNRFFKHAELKDGLLVVKSYDPKLLRETDKIVIPPSFLPTVLNTVHHKANHPTKHQMLQIVNRYFFTSGLEHRLNEMLAQCSLCTSLKKFPTSATRTTEYAPPTTPGTHMNSDVIRRAGQCILVTVDLFTSYTTSTIIKSETMTDLADGIIATTTPIRLSSNITVRTDRAPALQALAKGHNNLSAVGIQILLPQDAFNKNANCHIDKIIQELEAEIRRISPLGKPLTPAELAKATICLNNRVRKSGWTASESHFLRDSATLQPISQQPSKATKSCKAQQPANVSPGDAVFIKSQGNKHQARQPFLVTSTDRSRITVRKILHSFPGSSRPPKLSHIQQTTTPSSIFPAPLHFKPPPAITPPSTTAPPQKPPEDSDSDYDDPTPPPSPPPPPPGPPTPPPAPPLPPPPPVQPILQLQNNLAGAIRQLSHSHPPSGNIIPSLIHLHSIHRAQAQLTLTTDNANHPHPQPLPPPTTHPPQTQSLPLRQAKLQAIAKLSHSPIPQVEGAEPTPDSSITSDLPPTPAPPQP